MKVFSRRFTLGARGRFELPVETRPNSEDVRHARSNWPWGSYAIVTGSTHVKTFTRGNDQICHCVSRSDEVSVLSVTATNVVQEAQRRFRTALSGTTALGHALMATTLLNVTEPSAEALQIRVIGTGSVGCVTALCSGSGFVKGYLDFPRNDFPLLRNGRVDMKGTLGERGALVIKLHSQAWKECKVRSVHLAHGDIAKGVRRYLSQARKVHSFVSFGVSFDWQGHVSGAHGYLFQAMPNASSELLAQMEVNMGNLPCLTSPVSVLDARQICTSLFGGIEIGRVESLSSPQFGPCGHVMKQRVLESEIARKGFWEIRRALKSKGYIEAFCDACGEEYRYVEQELGELVGASVSDSEEEW